MPNEEEEEVKTDGILPTEDEQMIKRENGKPSEGEQRQTDWLSIYLCSVCQFFSSAQCTLFVMSMFPLMKMLDVNSTEASFGLVIAMYSLAQVLSSPLVGWFSNNCMGGSVRLILIALEFVMLAGNCLYFLVELFPSFWARHVLMTARFLVGIGAGNIGLFRAYVSLASLAEDRSRAIALVTTGQALGFTVGPAFQMLFSWIGFPGLSLLGGLLHLSMFTAPALFAVIMNIFNAFCLTCFFKENFVALAGHRKVSSDERQQQLKQLPPCDRLALFFCYSMRMSLMLFLSNFQTLGASFAMLMFSWSATEVVRLGSLTFAAKGFVAFTVYMAFICLDLGKRISERQVCFFSLLGILLFYLLTFSWPFLPENVEMQNGQGINLANSTADKQLLPGCDRSLFHWCDGLKRVNVWLFNALYILIPGITMSCIHVATNTLFSKIIGPRLQGTQQGLMQMIGGIGHLLGPILIGYFYTLKGPRLVWLMEMGVALGMLLILSMAYRRLVPLRMGGRREEEKD